MSIVACVTCGYEWDASSPPRCARCEYQRLVAAPCLVNAKHDPRMPPLIGLDYRSRLSHDFVNDLNEFIECAIVTGTWLYSRRHETWNLFVHEPLGRVPGSGIHAGDATPEHPLDGLLLADVLADPHAFAVDGVRILRQIQNGEFVPLSRCGRANCDNLSVPGPGGCALHADPPLASPVAPRAGA